MKKLILLTAICCLALALFGCTQQLQDSLTKPLYNESPSLKPSTGPLVIPSIIPAQKHEYKEVSATDSSGTAYLQLQERQIQITFLSEEGKPLPELAVAFATENQTNTSVLVIIDGSGGKRIPFKVIQLVQGDNPRLLMTPGMPARISIRLNKQGTYAIPKMSLPWLKPTIEVVGTVSNIHDAIISGAKLLDKAGLPLGEYAGQFDNAETLIQTPEEAMADLKDEINKDIIKTIVFSIPATIYTGPTPVKLGVDAAVIALSAGGFYADYRTIMACSGPNKQIEVITVGPPLMKFKFYRCKAISLDNSEFKPMTLSMKLNGETPANCKLTLLSEQYLGFAQELPLGPECRKQVNLPQGRYYALIEADGMNANSREVNLTNGVNFNVETTIPKLNATITPAREITGVWKGTASFEEDNIYNEPATGEVLCSWSGPFTLYLVQSGNDVIGYNNKGALANWSYFEFQITNHQQTIVSATGTVPPAGCFVPSNGVLSAGIDSGTISSTAIRMSTNNKETFSGSFTTDILSLALTNCLMQAGDSCTVKDGAKWKIHLTRQK